jgi:cyclohexadienyl dehydratase
MMLKGIAFLLLFSAVVAAESAELGALVRDRLSLMNNVAAYKWAHGLPIEDLAREQIVLEQAVQRSLRRALRSEDTRRFFGQQISAAKEIQAYWFSYWQNHLAPVAPPDLEADIRPRLIRLGNQIIDRLNTATTITRDSFLSTMAMDGLSKQRAELLYEASISIDSYPDALTQILDSGYLRVGTTGDYAPFSFRVSNASVFTGIDIDLAYDLAATLDVKILFIETSWPTLLKDLGDGLFDIAMTGVSRNLQRAQVGYFSDPYHVGGKTPISRCADKDKYSNLVGIDMPDTRLIVNPGGTNERFIDLQIQYAKKIIHSDNRTIFLELVNGRADVMITDQIEVHLQLPKHPELCATMPNDTLSFQAKGFLMAQDIKLKHYVDLWLAQRIGDKTMQNIFAKYVP